MRRLPMMLAVAGLMLAGAVAAQADVTRLSDSATFTTIQGAINDTGTSAGETLSVSAGTYAENVTIPQAKPNLKILGAGASSTTVDITGGGNAFTTYAPATITGFYITGPGRGSGTALKFVGDTSAGDRCSGTAADPGVFSSNKVDNVNYGVQSGDWNIEHWEFEWNVFDNLRIGVGLENMSYMKVSRNTFDDFKEGVSMGWGDDTAHHVTITCNEFIKSHHFPKPGGTSNDELAAILLSSSTHDVLVCSNDISDSIVGVLVRDPGGNTLDLSNVSVQYNNIVGNTSGITNEHVGSSLLAKNNWWGAASGPGGVGPGTGDPVSLYVDYTPWLASAQPPCPIPEPGALSLLGLGLVGLARRKRRS